MSSEYMTGEDIIKRSKIKRIDLFKYVKNGLKPYTEIESIINCPPKYNIKIQLDGINDWIAKLKHPDFPKNLSRWEEERVFSYDTPEIFLHELNQAKIEYTKRMTLLDKKTGDRSSSWFYFDDRCSTKESKKKINDIVNSYFLKDDVSKFIPSNKKLLPCQRHKEACRKAAKVKWKKEPNLTITAMSKRPEIINACEGKIYRGKHTIRDWIKDLCPNRKVGRPKGT